MAGLIRREDIDLVRERARIEDVVGEHVTLKAAGVGSMKGLCPFHDERSPSFHVRPQLGRWHCFGCSEGGDVFSFLQKINHVTFTEAVEALAGKYGVQLRYEGGNQPRRGPSQSQRRRLLDANRIAEEFYRGHLNMPEAEEARRFLLGRGFSRGDIEKFGCGAAPGGWDGLTKHLRSKAFTDEEIVASGLAIMGQRGPYDRFRDRVMWPIRDVTGATVGFGARRLGDDPNSPKYLNTPETPIYHKSQVLYGLDLAKKDISRQRKVVVVEGYTDVMAAHAAGETTAVATCGTAFGKEHTQLMRRLLGDVESASAGVMLADGRARGGEVIFTFDGDEAGKAAARRAYVEDQAFAAQTFVAVDPDGMDPCDLRMAGGDEALQRLIASRVPLFEFVLRSVLSSLNLDTAEGRVQGLRSAAPILAGIKDRALQTEYAREVAGWIGLEPREVERAMFQAARVAAQTKRQQPPADPRNQSRINPNQQSRGGAVAQPQGTGAPGDDIQQPEQAPRRPLLPDAGTGPSTERLALAASLQRPLDVVGVGLEELTPGAFQDARNAAMFNHLMQSGGLSGFLDRLQEAEMELGVGEAAVAAATRRWVGDVQDEAEPQVADDLIALMVLTLPVEEENQREYAQGLVRSLVIRELERQTRTLQSRLARLDSASPEAMQAFEDLWGIERRRRTYLQMDE
ncbi:DNA primase [Actinomyces minihominis]|uniref:DNA primase n=1 Tax=Actinomyces minihominis TaxID=2002838 RepID=UPI000C0685A9|nr:DNA primase [Actinomyces minihominis]